MGRECDLIEAGLNEAAGGWALGDSGKCLFALDVEPGWPRKSAFDSRAAGFSIF